MPLNMTGVLVVIASPGDTDEERAAVRDQMNRGTSTTGGGRGLRCCHGCTSEAPFLHSERGLRASSTRKPLIAQTLWSPFSTVD